MSLHPLLQIDDVVRVVGWGRLLGVTAEVELRERKHGDCTFCSVMVTSDETPHSNGFVRGVNACGPGAGPTAMSLGFSTTLT